MTRAGSAFVSRKLSSSRLKFDNPISSHPEILSFMVIRLAENYNKLMVP